MRNYAIISIVVVVGFLNTGSVNLAHALGTGFTYQGQLQENGVPAVGPANLRFSLWDAVVDGNQIGGSQVIENIPVTGGLFSVTLNEANQFGADAFNGAERWLQVEECLDGACAAPDVFLPRQPLTGVPYAHYAVSAPWSGLTGVPAGFADGVDDSGDSVWGVIEANVFRNIGNVGIGTDTPHHRLGISGGPVWTSNAWTGSIELDNGTAIGWKENAGHKRFGIGHSDGGLYFFNTESDPGTATNPAVGAMTITDAGLVGIGTTAPDTKLQVNDGRIRIRETASPERWDLFYESASEKFYLQENAAFNHLVFTKGPDNRIGIGTNDPVAGTKLHALTSAVGGVAIMADAPGGNGLVGKSAAPSYAASAGLNSSADGIGMFGEASTGSSSIGVFGKSNQGTAVLGVSTLGYGLNGVSTTNVGVKGSSNSNVGVQGISTGSYGIEGRSDSSEGVYGYSGSAYGVYGLGDTSTGTGVRGDGHNGVEAVTNSSEGYGILAQGAQVAGRFEGDVEIVGDVFYTGQLWHVTFDKVQIDHPLDPQNKYLNHSSVLSSDTKNIYDGNVVTDEKGYADVLLPEWCETINKNFRYQLTVVEDADSDEFVQAKVVRKIAGNQFTIRTSRPNVEVSWQVTGIRNDLYAKTHPFEAEVAKSSDEKGKYLAPELYGQSKEMGIHYRPETQMPSAQRSADQ
jgi:hypothetical protein